MRYQVLPDSGARPVGTFDDLAAANDVCEEYNSLNDGRFYHVYDNESMEIMSGLEVA